MKTSENKKSELENKKGISKVAQKGDALTESSISDIDKKLLENLDNVNLDSLQNSTIAKGGNLWTKEAKNRMNSENDTSARRMLRQMQIRLSKDVVIAFKKASLVTDLESRNNLLFEAKNYCKNLLAFYQESLIDLRFYTQRSKKLSEQDVEIIKTAYEKMIISENIKF